MDVWADVFLISVPLEVSGQLGAPAALVPETENPSTHGIGGWVGPRAGLHDMEKRKILIVQGLELRLLGHPAHNQSLYRLRYPGSLIFRCTAIISL
jgi:hypothetical protein